MDQSNIGTYIFQKVTNTIKNTIEYDDEDEVNEAYQKLHKIYTIRKHESTPFLFHDPVNRVAYMYRFFTGICASTKRIWQSTYISLDSVDKVHFETVLRKSDILISSIGGGPATDVIAFHSFLISLGLNGVTNASVFDAATQWKNIAIPLIRACKNERRSLSCNFCHFNFAEDYNGGAVIRSLQTADVVSIVKFFSAVQNVPDRYEILQNMISNMKPGSLLFFMDNMGEATTNLEKTFQNSDFICINWDERLKINISLKCHENERFDFRPQEKMHIFATMWRKNNFANDIRSINNYNRENFNSQKQPLNLSDLTLGSNQPQTANIITEDLNKTIRPIRSYKEFNHSAKRDRVNKSSRANKRSSLCKTQIVSSNASNENELYDSFSLELRNIYNCYHLTYDNNYKCCVIS